jgi:hypothetical protein
MEVTGGKRCNVNFKPRRMGWVVHVICVGRRRNACDICGQDEKCM